MELAGEHATLLERGDEAPAVLGGGDRCSPAPPAPDSCSRSRRSRARAAGSRARARPGSSRTAAPAPLRGSARRGRGARQAPASGLSSLVSNSTCRPTHMASVARPAPTRAASAASSPASRRPAMVAPKLPTPGSTTWLACSIIAASSARRGRAPSRMSAARTDARFAVPVGTTTTSGALTAPPWCSAPDPGRPRVPPGAAPAPRP